MWEAEGFRELGQDKKNDSPICILTAGLSAGAAAGAMDVPYEFIEKLCMGKGDPICRFEGTPIGKEKKVIR